MDLINRLAIPFLAPATNHMSSGNWHWDGLKKKFSADLAALTAGLPLLRIPLPDTAHFYVVMADGRADVDGRLKSLLDGLQAIGVIEDDKQIVSLYVKKVAKEAMDARMIVIWHAELPWDEDKIGRLYGEPVKTPKQRKRKAKA